MPLSRPCGPAAALMQPGSYTGSIQPWDCTYAVPLSTWHPIWPVGIAAPISSTQGNTTASTMASDEVLVRDCEMHSQFIIGQLEPDGTLTM
jgi:hypothetical protein